MESADVTILSDLWVASWQETLPEIDFAARRPWIVDFLGRPDITTRVVLGRDDRPAGFAAFTPGYLHQLVVAPEAKGRGVARYLSDDAKEANPAGLDLDVNQANARAIRFYQREGFTVAAAGRNETSGLPTWRLRWTP